MSEMRGMANTMLLATALRPVVRVAVARWRKRAQASAPRAISVPVQQLIEAALLQELSASAPAATRPNAPAAPRPNTPAGALIETTDASALRSVLIVAGAIAAGALITMAVAALIRRRRAVRQAQVEGPDWVAVPVDEATEAAEDALALGERAE